MLFILLSFQNGLGDYAFSWAVKDSYSRNDYGHSERRRDRSTSGQYHVLLPDGRVQTVTYTADHYNGYVADVTYEGEAVRNTK